PLGGRSFVYRPRPSSRDSRTQKITNTLLDQPLELLAFGAVHIDWQRKAIPNLIRDLVPEAGERCHVDLLNRRGIGWFWRQNIVRRRSLVCRQVKVYKGLEYLPTQDQQPPYLH